MAPSFQSSVQSAADRSVLFCSTIEALWGGSEVLWNQAAVALKARGVRVGAFFPYFRDNASTRRLAAAGIALYFGTPGPVRWWRRLARTRLSPLAAFQASLEDMKPDLVICNQGGTRDGLANMSVCQKTGHRYAILNQAVEPLLHDDVVWRAMKTAFAGADHVWCVSVENLEALRTYLNDPFRHAEIVPNAYACPFDVRCPWPDDDSTTRLAVAGRLYPIQKAQDLVLDVLAAGRWRARPLHVDFFGEGPAAQWLQARCAALELNRVTFAGHKPVGEIWSTHHALLLPSRFEGQSLAMIEAMLYGRPVIATPAGGTRGVVLDGETGFLAATCGSAAAIDEVLERAWNDRAKWRQFGAAARRRIREIVWRDPGSEFADRVDALLRAVAPTNSPGLT